MKNRQAIVVFALVLVMLAVMVPAVAAGPGSPITFDTAPSFSCTDVGADDAPQLCESGGSFKPLRR